MSHNKKPIVILIAEDDAEDRMLLHDALEEGRLKNEIHFVENGEDILDYLHNRGKIANLSVFNGILFYFNSPKKDGREELKQIKSDPHLRLIPVVVLTTSKAEEDILRTYDMGVSSFITKPVTFTALVDVMKTLSKYWFEIVELPKID